MVAAFDIHANDESHSEIGMLSGKSASSPATETEARAADSSRSLQNLTPASGSQSAQKTAPLIHAAMARQHGTALESAGKTALDANSVSAHSKRAKSSTIASQSTVKTMQGLADSAAMLASDMTLPVQTPSIKGPAHSPAASQEESTNNAHSVAASIDHGTRAASDGRTSDAEASTGHDAAFDAEPAQSSEKMPALRLESGIALLEPSQAASRPGDDRPTAASDGDSAELAAGQSALSADDLNIASSVSSAAEASTAEPSVAESRPAQAELISARVGTGAFGAHGSRGGDSQSSPSTVKGIDRQLNGAALDTTLDPAMIRAGSAASPANQTPGTATASAPGVSTAGTFSALDGAGNAMHATWVHAGAERAEAGFEDPSLGWISVRAGVNAGSIGAVVVPGSAEATQALGAHMAGLHDYLREQHASVDSLTLAATQNSFSDQGTSRNPGYEQQQQGRQSGQDGTGDSRPVQPVAANTDSSQSALRADLRSAEITPIASASGARYISVLA